MAAVITLLFPHPAAALLFASTGIVGAQVQVDTLHSQWWQFKTTEQVVLDGGMFTMKKGPRTQAPVTFELFPGMLDAWNGVGSVADTLIRRTLASNAFTQSYGRVSFLAPAPVVLRPGLAYTAVLSASDAPDRQSEAYFIKGGSAADMILVDETGNAAGPALTRVSQESGLAVATPVSAPGTGPVLGLGALLLMALPWLRGRGVPRPLAARPRLRRQ